MLKSCAAPAVCCPATKLVKGYNVLGAGGGEAGGDGTEVDVEAEEREVLSMAAVMGVGREDLESALLGANGDWETVLRVRYTGIACRHRALAAGGVCSGDETCSGGRCTLRIMAFAMP